MQAAFLFVSVSLVWEILSITVPNSLIPSPLDVYFETLLLLVSSTFYYHLGHTVARILISFIISLFLSIALAYLAEKKIRSLTNTFVIIGLITPAVVLSFILIILFGAREITSVLVVLLSITPQLTVIIVSGVESLNPQFLELSKIYRLEPKTYIKDIVFPQLYPTFIAALQVGLSTAWKIVILTEGFAVNNGVGYMIYYQFQLFSLKGVLAWTLAFAILILLVIKIITIGFNSSAFVLKKGVKWISLN